MTTTTAAATLQETPSGPSSAARLSEARCHVSIKNDQTAAISQGLTQHTVPLPFHHRLYCFTTGPLASATMTLTDRQGS